MLLYDLAETRHATLFGSCRRLGDEAPNNLILYTRAYELADFFNEDAAVVERRVVVECGGG